MIHITIQWNAEVYTSVHPNKDSAVRWVSDMLTALFLAHSIGISTEITIKAREE